MDVSTKRACFEEITHQICDADLKVSINDISSNWKINFRESESVLLDWCLEHCKTSVSKEYLIRGVDPQGHCVISVVPESRLANAKTLFPQFCSSLYSVQLPSTSVRLGGHKLSTDVVINLPLEGKERANRSAQSVEVVRPVSKVDVKTVVKKETKAEPLAKAKPINVVKAETNRSPPKAKETPEKHVKVEPSTPKQQSPPKKNDAVQTPAKKASIASFFAKPAAAKAAPKIVKNDQMEIEAEAPKVIPKDTTPVKKDSIKKEAPATKPLLNNGKSSSSRKRSIADAQDSDEHDHKSHDDDIPATPEQSSSKRVRKDTSSKVKKSPRVEKRSKRANPVESSDEEDIPSTPQVASKNNNKSAIESKLVSRLRRIVDSDSEDDNPPPKPDLSISSTQKRRKAKRTVTRMYQDEDGYMKSVKEIEEYTCSEDEADAQTPQISAVEEPSENIPPTQPKNAVKTPTKKIAKKKTPPKAAANKQGSILSFFSKK